MGHLLILVPLFNRLLYVLEQRNVFITQRADNMCLRTFFRFKLQAGFNDIIGQGLKLLVIQFRHHFIDQHMNRLLYQLHQLVHYRNIHFAHAARIKGVADHGFKHFISKIIGHLCAQFVLWRFST